MKDQFGGGQQQSMINIPMTRTPKPALAARMRDFDLRDDWQLEGRAVLRLGSMGHII